MTRTSLRSLLWLASTLALVGYLYLGWQTLFGTPADDPFAAAILEHATRFAAGESPYSDATPGPPLMPGFPFVVSWLLPLLGPKTWLPGLVGLITTLAAAGLALQIVRAETESATLGAAAAGLVLMGQQIANGVGGFARPETLMLLLVLLGCMAVRYAPALLGAALAAVCFTAACFTHPAGLLFAFAALLHLGVHDSRRLVVFGSALTILMWSVQLALPMRLGPWFNDAAWDAVGRALHFEPIGLLRYVGTQLLGALGIFTLATVLAFALPTQPWRGAVGIWTWMGFAALVAGVAATQFGTSPAEVTRATVVVVAIIGPLSVQRITQHLSSWPGATRMGGQAVVLTAIMLQFVTLFAAN